MSVNTFNLSIMTPERQFFSDDVEALTITAPDGELTILAGHAPMVATLKVGSIRIKQNGVWKKAFNSGGFIEVEQHECLMFVQACEWPEDIDIKRAQQAKHRAEEKLRQHHSLNEYRGSKIALARAIARLRITSQKVNLD